MTLCSTERARPLGPRRVIGTLRKHGYGLVPDPHPVCAPQIVTLYVNVASEGSDSYKTVVDSEGDIGCEVDKEPYPAARPKPWQVRIHDDRDLNGTFEVGIANVICQISPAAGKERVQVQRLAKALRALAPSVSAS